MTAIRRVLADARQTFGTRALVAELVGGALCMLAGAVLVLGVAVVLP